MFDHEKRKDFEFGTFECHDSIQFASIFYMDSAFICNSPFFGQELPRYSSIMGLRICTPAARSDTFKKRLHVLNET